MYEKVATSKTPALIVYLLDVSGSMDLVFPNTNKKKIDYLPEVLWQTVKVMIRRATRGDIISPRYKIAMLAYSDDVYPIYQGWKTIDELANTGLPKKFNAMRSTDTYKGFQAVKQLLEQEMKNLSSECPPPLVCHLTDGETNKQDPTPMIEEIKQLSVPDGNVLLENVFLTEKLANTNVDLSSWPGYFPNDDLGHSYGNCLLAQSSMIPDTYVTNINEFGYKIQNGTKMMYPGISPEFVRLAFVISGMTSTASPADLDK